MQSFHMMEVFRNPGFPTTKMKDMNQFGDLLYTFPHNKRKEIVKIK